MDFLSDPSLKRFIALIAGLLTTALNKKLGLDLPESEVLGLLTLVGSYIIASKGGAAVIAHAEAKGAAAAAAMTAAEASTVLARAATEGAKLAPEVKP